MSSCLEDIDIHRSTIYIQAGLKEASKHQNQWFMGERKNHSISPIEANVDWTVHYAKIFNKRFEENKNEILNYVNKHRDEIKKDKGRLIFTSEQFNYLMGNEIKMRQNPSKDIINA